MKIVCFLPSPASHPHHGALLSTGEVLDFEAPGADLPTPRDPLAWLDLTSLQHLAAAKLVNGASADSARLVGLRSSGALLQRDAVQLVSPVPRPGKVICIGLNYKDHAEESGMDLPEAPLVFSKFSSCVVGPGVTVIIPPGSVESDYEAELGVVIGRRATRISEQEAMGHVLGYVNVNDVTARDFQFADGQWQRGKSSDTFCPVGEYIATTEEIPDPHKLRIQFRLNGQTLQDSNTDQLHFQIPKLVSYLSNFTTLEPGDVIATGTPPGVGFARKPPIYIKDGDLMEVEIEGLGVLANPVAGA